MNESGTKTCPYCAETIKAAAIKCRYCLSDLSEAGPGGDPTPGDVPPAHGLMPFLPSPGTAPEGDYRLELISTHIEPVLDPISFFVVRGRATNLSKHRQSLHISIFGRTRVFNTAWQVGMMGQTATPTLASGETTDWQAKLATSMGNAPTYLRYVVALQSRPGALAVNTLDALENPALLGGMASSMMAQLNSTISGFDSTPAPEGDFGLDVTGGSSAPTGTPLPAKHDAPPPPKKEWAHMASAVPLTEWRGMGKMVRKSSVPAYCTSCGTDWALDSKVSNTIAQEQGLAGKLQRGGTSMERFGATFSPFSSGRRIAAGNEQDRQQQHLANLYTLAACPNCRGLDVILAK